jgi:sporulation protein YlmC with PRC-barrel domain
MKNFLALMSIMVFLGSVVFAQDTVFAQRQSQPPTIDQRTKNTSSEYLFRVTQLLGREIQNPQGEFIGQVEDLIITKDDQVVRVVVSVGGFLGLGEKLVAISYEGLHIDPQKGIIVYAGTQQELAEQPEFHYQEKEMEIPIRRINK